MQVSPDEPPQAATASSKKTITKRGAVFLVIIKGSFVLRNAIIV
jgi:hypothetical protein